nr:hypothetical protein [Hoylesella enoeca]
MKKIACRLQAKAQKGEKQRVAHKRKLQKRKNNVSLTSESSKKKNTMRRSQAKAQK